MVQYCPYCKCYTFQYLATENMYICQLCNKIFEKRKKGKNEKI